MILTTILITLIFLDLLVISITDIERSEIFHTNTIVLLILAILYCINEPLFDWKFTIPLFVVITISQIVMFLIFGESAIGGGDVKILSISMLFLHTLSDMFIYLIVLSVTSILGVLWCKIRKETHLRYGPCMALSLLIPIFISHYSLIYTVQFTILFALLIFTIKTFFWKGEITNYVIKNKAFF